MSSPEKIPHGWVKVKSKSHVGKIYFYNKELKKSVWKLTDINKSLAKQNNGTTPQKSPDKQLSRISARSKSINKSKNLAEQRMKNLKMALVLERDDEKPTAPEKHEVKVKKSKSKELIANVPKSTNKIRLSPRKRAERKDPVVNQEEAMEVDQIPSQEPIHSVPEDYVESMEWEQIDESQVVNEVLHIRSLKSNASSLVIPRDSSTSHANDGNKFFIVVDTNIFCSNLQFIERIKGKHFKDIGNACIYIPYIVLCELDMLKTREGHISKVAQRGIKTINEYFKEKDVWVIGQSIKDDTRKMIPIDSGDDRILNCAFQLKEQTKRVLLLSNDINLRNKAFVNGFEAYSVDMLNYADYNITNTIKFE